MSGAENLRFFASLFGLKGINPDELLDRVGLADRGDDRVAKYSKGMRQRLMMARTLVNRVAFINDGRLHAVDTPENLKLKHGKRSVRIRVKENGEVTERTVQLDEAGAGERLREAVDTAGLMTIHTEEATLENIFIEMTGRGLAG